MVEVAAYVLRSLSEPETRDLTLSLVPVLKNVVLDRMERFSLPKWQAAREGLKRHQAIAELENLEAAGFIQRCPGEMVRFTPLWRSVATITAPSKAVYPPLVCIRALEEDDKSATLAMSMAGSIGRRTFVCDPGRFAMIPGSTFAYWVSDHVLNLFRQFPTFGGEKRTAKQGLATADDFRFIRATWEVPRTLERGWVPFCKGGAFSPYYADIHLVVKWHSEGDEMKAWAETLPG